MLVLVAFNALPVNVRLGKPQVRVITHRVEVTRIKFTGERSVATDARSVLVSCSDVCVEYLLQFSPPLGD
jgi:hypothetical protein